MKKVAELNQVFTSWFTAGRSVSAEPLRYRLGGEMGYRLDKIIHRLSSELPYSREYILGQITGEAGVWSNFPRFHGDICGRWILAMSFACSGEKTPPAFLREVVDEVLRIQNEDGSFGKIQFSEEPLNKHKAYGNGWMLRGLVEYATTFRDAAAQAAAVKLGDFYEKTFSLWAEGETKEGGDSNYAVSRSCYFHALDGLVALYRLTRTQRYLDLAERFIPLCTPLENADHAHMYLTVRRGMIELFSEKGQASALADLVQELETVYRHHTIETGGIPERFHKGKSGLRCGCDANFADEACGNFDWLLICLRLRELGFGAQWADRAAFVMETHLWFNQYYNGGFGDLPMGAYYTILHKEAPWCCSLFGPFGLTRAGAFWVRQSGDAILVDHPVTGDYDFGTVAVSLKRDTVRSVYVIRGIKGKVRLLLRVPFWMEYSGRTAKDGVLEITVNENETVELPFRFRLWLSRHGEEPAPVSRQVAGGKGVLFYGPWLLAHRFNDPLPRVSLETDAQGFVENFQAEPLLGCNFYGETTRITLPANTEISPNDVARGVEEQSGEIRLYPLKDREPVWRAITQIQMENL